jgi:two-component system cell cycle sensor histidine kinase/response regulator CckA
MTTPEHAPEPADRYRLIVENCLEAIAVCRAERDDQGRITDLVYRMVNSTFCQMAGKPAEAITGHRMSEVFPGVREEGTIDRYGNVIDTGQPFRGESHSEKLQRHVLVHAFRIDTDELAIAFLDKTEEKQRVSAMTASEMRFKAIFEGTSQGILVVERDSKMPRYVNPAFCRLLGYTQEEMMAMPVPRLHPPDVLDAVREDFESLTKLGSMRDRIQPCVCKDGTIIWADIRASLVRIDDEIMVIGFFNDVTKQRVANEERERLLERAEQSRRALLSVLEDQKRGDQERARLASAIEQAAETVVITDTKGFIQYVNPAFTRVSGYTREEALGQHTRILKSGRQDEAYYKAMWNAISNGQAWSGRLYNKKKNGEIYLEDATISPVFNAQGELNCFVAVKRDITRETEVEHQLNQSQRMELIGQLAGGVAHDFNNILQSMLGFAELAMTEEDPETLRSTYLPEIHRAGLSAAGLTRQLLAFSRRQVLERKVIDMNELVERMGKMIRRVIGEDMKLSLELAPHINPVFVDPGQAEQVILNLVVNARDAMPEGGQLRIATSEVEVTEAMCATRSDAQPGCFIRLSVIDTGTGMTAEVQRHIFEPFFTTKGLGKGTGLGLATVFGIVKQHGGWINVDSELGRGTTFEVFFPVQRSEATADGELAPAPLPRGKQKRILLVEDEEMVRSMMARLLHQHGYEVLLARDAEEALTVMREASQPVDVICSDVVLPGRSGFDLVSELTKEFGHLRVIMVSGYTDDRTRWAEIREQGWRYLQKPVSAHLLLTTLREVLEQP